MPWTLQDIQLLLWAINNQPLDKWRKVVAYYADDPCGREETNEVLNSVTLPNWFTYETQSYTRRAATALHIMGVVPYWSRLNQFEVQTNNVPIDTLIRFYEIMRS